jgi:S-adenosylmethionine:tRNA ribosyltransferase-isomerase
MLSLADKGVSIIPITHATGLSTTGDDRLDALLPFPEETTINERSARRINTARADDRRIIAIGTGVTRALEAAYSPSTGDVRSGTFASIVKLSDTYTLNVVDGLMTGMHEPDSSHAQLMRAFLSHDMLDDSNGEAVERDYLGHEYGDVALVMGSKGCRRRIS